MNKVLPILILMVITLTACDTNRNKRERLSEYIAQQISTTLENITDSTFQSTVVAMIDNTDKTSVNVRTDSVTTDSAGNRFINVYVDVDDNNEIPDDWWIGPLVLVGTIFTLGAPIFVVFIICYFIYKSKRDRNRVISEAIAAGRQLPDSFYRPWASDDKKPRLQSGINYLAWGIGLWGFFMAVGTTGTACLMLIPIIIGLGKIVAYIFAAKKEKKESDRTEQFPPLQ